MTSYLSRALTLLACSLAAPCLPAMAQALNAPTASQYVPLEIPCRAVDTRISGGPIAAGTLRSFNPASGGCSLPAPTGGIYAYALNVTVVPHGPLNFVTVWPAGELQPVVSTLNSPDGRSKANAAIVSAGIDGQVSVYASDTTDVVLDVSGYFIGVLPLPLTYTFFPITPCRVVDTRVSNGSFGAPSLVPGQQRAFELDMSSCNLSKDPEDTGGAFSINVTVIPKGGKPVGFVTVWGTSVKAEGTPPTSTLNAPTGAITANAALIAVNAATGESLSVYSSDETDLVIDVNGYFAFGQLVPGGLSLYTQPPCRILDTRGSTGEFQNERTVPVTTGNNCSVSGTAKAYVVNATVVPPASLSYLTLWADGATQPVVSTLNAVDGLTTSNMAIVQSTNGSIDAFASQPTQLILDISSYFAP